MKDKQYSMPAQLLLRLATLIALTIAFLVSGCEAFKKASRNKNDSASVKKTTAAVENSNHDVTISKENNRSTEENEWFRLTMKWLNENKARDSSVNYPDNAPFKTSPSTIIYESGSSKLNQESIHHDSSWYLSTMKMIAMVTDSISRKVDNYEKTKQTQTKGVGLLTIVLVGLAPLALIYYSKSFTRR